MRFHTKYNCSELKTKVLRSTTQTTQMYDQSSQNPWAKFCRGCLTSVGKTHTDRTRSARFIPIDHTI